MAESLFSKTRPLRLNTSSQNHRIIKAGKEAQDHQVQPLSEYHHAHSTVSQRATSAHFFDTSRDGDSAMSPR